MALATRIVAAVAVSALASTAGAAVLADYQFLGTTGNASLASTDTDAGSLASDFLDGVGYDSTGFSSQQPGAAANGVSRQVNGAGTSSNALNNFATGDYFFFTVDPIAGNQLNLDNLSFYADRSGSSPDRITAFILPNGVEADAIAVASGTVGTNFPFFDSGDLSGIAELQGLSSAEVRLVFRGNNTGNGDNRIDAVVLEGESVIPEPALAGVIGLAGLLGLRRRR